MDVRRAKFYAISYGFCTVQQHTKRCASTAAVPCIRKCETFRKVKSLDYLSANKNAKNIKTLFGELKNVKIARFFSF